MHAGFQGILCLYSYNTDHKIDKTKPQLTLWLANQAMNIGLHFYSCIIWSVSYKKMYPSLGGVALFASNMRRAIAGKVSPLLIWETKVDIAWKLLSIMTSRNKWYAMYFPPAYYKNVYKLQVLILNRLWLGFKDKHNLSTSEPRKQQGYRACNGPQHWGAKYLVIG